MEDVGASHGYLVNEAGVQSGARAFAEQQNITAVTFDRLAEALRAEQLRTRRDRAQDLSVRVVATEEDHGNWDSEASVAIHSLEGLPIGDRLVEVLIMKSRPGWLWSFTPQSQPRLQTSEPEIILNLPWDPINWLGLRTTVDCRLDGEEVDGWYAVIVRTVHGPMRIDVAVPPYK